MEEDDNFETSALIVYSEKLYIVLKCIWKNVQIVFNVWYSYYFTT